MRRAKRLGDKGGFDLEICQALDQRPGRSGRQFNDDLGKHRVIAGQQRRKAAAGRAFQRAQPEYSHRFAGAHGVHRLVSEPKQAIGIAEKLLAFRRKPDIATLAAEKAGTDMLFELANAGGDVRLDAVEFGRRAHDAALVHDRAENSQQIRDRSFSFGE